MSNGYQHSRASADTNISLVPLSLQKDRKEPKEGIRAFLVNSFSPPDEINLENNRRNRMTIEEQKENNAISEHETIVYASLFDPGHCFPFSRFVFVAVAVRECVGDDHSHLAIVQIDTRSRGYLENMSIVLQSSRLRNHGHPALSPTDYDQDLLRVHTNNPTMERATES